MTPRAQQSLLQVVREIFAGSSFDGTRSGSGSAELIHVMLSF